METEAIEERDPAYRAANAARVLGVLITLLAGLILVVSLFAIRSMGGIAGIVTLVMIVLIYLAPGIALLVLSSGVKRGSKGPTIAVLVIACLIAGLLWLGILGQAFVVISAGRFSAQMLLPIGFMIIIATVATLMAVYCIQSLRFPDRIDPKRGFEPILMATPIEPASAATAEPDRSR